MSNNELTSKIETLIGREQADSWGGRVGGRVRGLEGLRKKEKREKTDGHGQARGDCQRAGVGRSGGGYRRYKL